jgi:hypothetical protein
MFDMKDYQDRIGWDGGEGALTVLAAAYTIWKRRVTDTFNYRGVCG